MSPATRNDLYTFAVPCVIDGGGSVITTGVKAFVRMPMAALILRGDLGSDVAGDLSVRVLKSASGPPASGAGVISASAPLVLSAAQVYADATLAGWDTEVAEGDWIGFEVTGTPGTITKATVVLTMTRWG